MKKGQESLTDYMVRTIGQELQLIGIHKNIADFYLLNTHMSIVFKPKTSKFLVEELRMLYPEQSCVITNGSKVQFSLTFKE
jgi:hypothetical protein